MNRRSLLRAGIASSVIGLAGCSFEYCEEPTENRAESLPDSEAYTRESEVIQLDITNPDVVEMTVADYRNDADEPFSFGITEYTSGDVAKAEFETGDPAYTGQNREFPAADGVFGCAQRTAFIYFAYAPTESDWREFMLAAPMIDEDCLDEESRIGRDSSA